MKALNDFINECIAINEQNGDLERLLSKYNLVTNAEGEGLIILVQVKNPADYNPFSSEVYGGSSLYIPKDHSTQKKLKVHKDWGFIKFAPKTNGQPQIESIKLNQSTIKKLKATKIQSIDFKGTGFPQRGPVQGNAPVEYEAIYYKFNPDMLIKFASAIDSNYYVSGKGSVIFGIAALDKQIAWEPYHEFCEK